MDHHQHIILSQRRCMKLFSTDFMTHKNETEVLPWNMCFLIKCPRALRKASKIVQLIFVKKK